MHHSFNTDEAQQYGIEASVILEHLRFWIIKNRANGKHLHKGRYWTYSTTEALVVVFPYLTYNQIRRNLEKLEKARVLISDNFNATAYDRTKWYAFEDENGQLPHIHLAENTNGKGKKARPIPYSLTDSITDEELLEPPEAEEEARESSRKLLEAIGVRTPEEA